MKVRITKLQELPFAEEPHNILTGAERKGEMTDKPEVGKRFMITYYAKMGCFMTSRVTSIISWGEINDKVEIVFQTLNSIYKLEQL